MTARLRTHHVLLLAVGSAAIAMAACASPDVSHSVDSPSTTQASSVVVEMKSSSGASLGNCSGTLISSKVVLTAGHCIAGVASWSVSGSGKTVKASAGSTSWKAFGSDFSHPEYSDVGLIALDSEIKLSSYPQIASSAAEDGSKGTRVRRVSDSATTFSTTTAVLQGGASKGFRLNYLVEANDTFVDAGAPVLDSNGKIIGVVSGKGKTSNLLHIARVDNFKTWTKSATTCASTLAVRDWGSGNSQNGGGGYGGTPSTSSSGGGGWGGWGGSSSGGSWGSSSGGYGGGDGSGNGNMGLDGGSTVPGSSSSSSGSTSSSSGSTSSSSGSTSSGGSSGSDGNVNNGDGTNTCPGTPICEGTCGDGSSGLNGGTGSSSGGADNTTTTTNSDGSTSQVTKHPDGTTTIVTTTKNPDGSTTVTTKNPDGTTSTTTTGSDGSVNTTTQNPNGTTTTTTKTPDGTTTSTTKNPDGTTTTVTTQPDGSKTTVTTNPSGQIVPNPPPSTSESCGGSTDNIETCPAAPDSASCSGASCGGCSAGSACADYNIDYGSCAACSTGPSTGILK